MAAASSALGAWPQYSRVRSAKPNSASPQHCHRKSVSISAASASALTMSSAKGGASKRSNTLVALILLLLPCGASTCSDASLSASTAPTLKEPVSSYSTFMGSGPKELGWPGAADTPDRQVVAHGARAASESTRRTEIIR